MNQIFKNVTIFENSAPSFLIEKAVKSYGAKLSKDGALVVETGKHTGRSAQDKYVVASEETQKGIWWENNLNQISQEKFEELKTEVINFLSDKEELFVTKRSVGAHDKYRIGVNLYTSQPQHALFSQHLFREGGEKNTSEFTILHAPELNIDPKKYGTKNPTVIATCFETRTTIIVGTFYAGEIKKSMFCVLNYMLPESGVLPMHSGANVDTEHGVSVFFGLSGTGKTTLSTDEGKYLIGDDEHGLGPEGVFNFEGGCYAKTYKLDAKQEPEIWEATNHFGSMIENVTLDEQTGEIDFNDCSLTENGRSSYPLSFIEERIKESKGDIPKNIFFLTADAYGVLPPVASLTVDQAMFYFVLGYTSKVAGTEIGIKEPQATFSACFGGPFMLRHPEVYAKLLGKYIEEYGIKVWLINTGWTAGGYGVGERFPLRVTRSIIRAIQEEKMTNTQYEKDKIFGLDIPESVEGVDNKYLRPEKEWNDQESYVKAASNLADRFHEQMETFPRFYDEHFKGAPAFKNGKITEVRA